MSKPPSRVEKNPPKLLAHIPLSCLCTLRLEPRILSPSFNAIGTECRVRVAGLEGVTPSSNRSATAFGIYFSF